MLLHLLLIRSARHVPKYGSSIELAAHLVSMLFSGNTRGWFFFRSRTTTVAAAVNLPTPSTDTATSTANIAAIFASILSILLIEVAAGTTAKSAATHSTASALDAFASTAAAQKRKARPESYQRLIN
jgi:hypothetical protein